MGMKFVICLVVILAICIFEASGQRTNNRNNNRNTNRSNRNNGNNNRNRNTNKSKNGENKKQPQLLVPPVPEKCSSSESKNTLLIEFFLDIEINKNKEKSLIYVWYPRTCLVSY